MTNLHKPRLLQAHQTAECQTIKVSAERFQRDIFFSKTKAIYRYNYILKIRSKKREKQIVSISIYKIGQLFRGFALGQPAILCRSERKGLMTLFVSGNPHLSRDISLPLGHLGFRWGSDGRRSGRLSEKIIEDHGNHHCLNIQERQSSSNHNVESTASPSGCLLFCLPF